VFYDLCQDEQFGIKIEDVIKYLEIEKRDKFYERFKSNYKEGVDYMTYSTGLSKRSGNSNIMYKCTFNCFQKICMMSKSKKANSVRDYFITLHEFIDYYKNEISETINKKISKKGIYILEIDKKLSLYKPDMTDNDFRERLKQYGTGLKGHPQIKYLLATNNVKEVEDCVKKLIQKKEFKKGKEVYKIDLQVLKQICLNCAKSVNLLNKESTNLSSTNKDVDLFLVFDS
jgi:phage anti-repressor protein